VLTFLTVYRPRDHSSALPAARCPLLRSVLTINTCLPHPALFRSLPSHFTSRQDAAVRKVDAERKVAESARIKAEGERKNAVAKREQAEVSSQQSAVQCVAARRVHF
jgi:hypothetical protein